MSPWTAAQENGIRRHKEHRLNTARGRVMAPPSWLPLSLLIIATFVSKIESAANSICFLNCQSRVNLTFLRVCVELSSLPSRVSAFIYLSNDFIIVIIDQIHVESFGQLSK